MSAAVETRSKDFCSYCVSRIDNPDMQIITKCGDVFHKACLEHWFNIEKKCPDCGTRFKSIEDAEIKPFLFERQKKEKSFLRRIFEDNISLLKLKIGSEGVYFCPELLLVRKEIMATLGIDERPTYKVVVNPLYYLKLKEDK
jgi:hypothetical protein